MGRSKEYNAIYILNQYYLRREEAFRILGKICAVCGATQDLEFDHIDPTTKDFSIGRLWSVSKDRYNKELLKCQVLCKNCHIKKTIKDAGRVSAKETHGTLSSYRYCKCAVCKAAYNEYQRKYKKRKRKTF